MNLIETLIKKAAILRWMTENGIFSEADWKAARKLVSWRDMHFALQLRNEMNS